MRAGTSEPKTYGSTVNCLMRNDSSTRLDMSFIHTRLERDLTNQCLNSRIASLFDVLLRQHYITSDDNLRSVPHLASATYRGSKQK